MTTEHPDLESLFAAARTSRDVPSAKLLARVEADALTVIPMPKRAPVRRPRASFWATLVAAVGGTPGLAGLATAAAAGLWIGISAPAPVTGLAPELWSDAAASTLDSVELLPDLDVWLAEG